MYPMFTNVPMNTNVSDLSKMYRMYPMKTHNFSGICGHNYAKPIDLIDDHNFRTYSA